MKFWQNSKNWHMLADSFVWYDTRALRHIPAEISDKEVQKYLFAYHSDPISLSEIRQWREGTQPEDDDTVD